MNLRLFSQPVVAAAYALNVGFRARRGITGRTRHEGTAREIIHACIEDERLVVLIIRIGRRREVYR